MSSQTTTFRRRAEPYVTAAGFLNGGEIGGLSRRDCCTTEWSFEVRVVRVHPPRIDGSIAKTKIPGETTCCLRVSHTAWSVFSAKTRRTAVFRKVKQWELGG